MEDDELAKGGPEDPAAPREQAPAHHQLQHDDVDAGGDDPRAREEPDRPVEPRAGDPLPVQLQRPRPEVEEHHEHPRRAALAGHEQERRGRRERHVVLVHPETEVQQHDGGLHHVQADQPPVRPRRGLASGQECEPDPDRAQEIQEERPGQPGGAEHAEPLAFLEDRPADRLGPGVQEGDRPLVDPVEEGQDVQRGQGRPVDPQHPVVPDLGDLALEIPHGRAQRSRRAGHRQPAGLRAGSARTGHRPGRRFGQKTAPSMTAAGTLDREPALRLMGGGLAPRALQVARTRPLAAEPTTSREAGLLPRAVPL